MMGVFPGGMTFARTDKKEEQEAKWKLKLILRLPDYINSRRLAMHCQRWWLSAEGTGSSSAYQLPHKVTTSPAQQPDMAQWGDVKLFLCILCITCCCTVIMGQMPVDCCLEVRNKPIDKHAVVHYHRQASGNGCSIDAMVLVTRRKMRLCVPHDELWVQTVMKHVDNLGKFCKKRNYKPKRCRAMAENEP